MFRKYLSIALVCIMIPAAANAWTLASRVMTTGGNLQVNSGAPQTSINGTVSRSYSSDVPVAINAEPGYTISRVTINGTDVTPPPSSTTMGLGAYPTKTSQTIAASFAKRLVTLSVSVVGNGTASPGSTLNVAFGTRAVYTFSPASGRSLVSLTGLPGDAVLTYAADGTPATLPASAAVKATFTVSTTPVSMVASFAGIEATAAKRTVLTNSTAVLRGSATVYDGSSPDAVTYSWAQTGGPAVTLNGATTTTPSFPAAVAGSYQFRLTATSSLGATSTATSYVTVTDSPAEAANTQCQNCHKDANIDTAPYTAWAASAHQAKVVMCYDCHTGTHPDRVATQCATCHNSAAVHGVAALGCNGCHNSHSLDASATGFDHATVSPAPSFCGSCHGTIAANFATSLHGSRQGKATWYNDNLNNPAAPELQKGFGNYVQIAYADLPCGKCHNPAAWATGGVDQWAASTGGAMVCTDCHGNKTAGINTTSVAAPVTKSTCFGCHSRQANEASAGLTDVHFVAGMGCPSCHSTGDMHGNGTQHASQLAAGAISAQCENCHGEGKSRGPISSIAAHVQHAGNIACSTCHAESMITCHNCHFDNEAGAGGALKAKFFSGKMGGTVASGNSWRFLVNRVMPDGSTKIYPGSMQSLVADHTVDGVNDGKGHTHAGIAPYYSHTITRVNALTCDKCHGTETSVKLAAGQAVRVTTWKAEPGVAVAASAVATTFVGPKGVIPVPENPRGKLLMDFVDLTNPELGTNSNRVLFQKDGPDTIHMPEAYVKPLTAAQMQKLAEPQVDHTSAVFTSSAPGTGYNADTCMGCHASTNSTFAKSLHGSRTGKETFYNHNVGNAAAEPLQKGFGNYVNVGYTALPCADCHNPAAWTVAGSDTWPAQTAGTPVCTDCHTNKVNGTATTSFDAPVVKATCIGCHSRQANETSMGLTDVHTSGAVINGTTMNFGCVTCHSMTDMHGDGTQKASILDEGAITAKCENCHTSMAGSITPEHAVHLSNIACSTCHMESVITCYGCHFDNEASDPADSTILHAKFASGKFGGTAASGNAWRFLVNRVMPDGSTKVYPASMQSLVADRTAANAPGEDNAGWTHAAIAPYYSHSITRVNALKCDKCHGIQKAIDLKNGVPVRVVKWGAAAGTQVPVSSMMATYTTKPSGVIPVPENPVGKLLMDFVDLVNPAAGPLNAGGTSPSARVLFKADGPDSIHMPNAYVKPLTAAQINALATPQVRP